MMTYEYEFTRKLKKLINALNLEIDSRETISVGLIDTKAYAQLLISDVSGINYDRPKRLSLQKKIKLVESLTWKSKWL